MERRATMGRSQSSALPKMNACVALLVCGVLGSASAYYPERQAPYNVGPNDPYTAVASPNFLPEQSQRLFWSNGQGSNQVGGTGLWATLTNKFPFLGQMFGRMELSPEYGVPQVSTNYGVPQVSTNYGVPARFQPQFYQAPQQQYYTPQTYQAPQVYQVPQAYQPRQAYQQPQQVYQQPQQFPRFAAGGRDVGFTDDAIIVTPPQVPIVPPRPVAPAPLPPQPAPQPAGDGYSYNKPQYRLELPHK